MLARIRNRQSVRQLTMALNRLSCDNIDEPIYRENYIKYDKENSSFSEHTRIFYIDNKLKYHYLMNTDLGSMCKKCKGSGLIYPKHRITNGICDYRLCEECRGSGFR
jgi:hypothetical protein